MSAGILRISTTAIAQNYRRIVRHVGASVRVAGVLKANAYGLGMGPVAKALHAAGCRDFFVATVDEGVEVRECLGADPRVVVMGGVDAERTATYLQHRLTPAVNSLPQLRAFNAAVGASGDEAVKKPVGIFLQVDTGMTRLGLDVDERAAILRDGAAAEMLGSDLQIEFVMTHVACADDPADTLNATQRRDFDDFVGGLRAAVKGTHHEGFKCTMASTILTWDDPSAHYDMVRPGLTLYTWRPELYCIAPDAPPKPTNESTPNVLLSVRLTAPVVQVRQAAKGSKVSYSAKFTCERDSVIGVVGIGYADGFRRAIGNKGAALYWTPAQRDGPPPIDASDDAADPPRNVDGVNTFRLPIVGTVCMDSCMVDLTDLPPEKRPQEGDQLEVVGPNQTPDQLGAYFGTIGYEILTSLGRRFHRIYE